MFSRINGLKSYLLAVAIAIYAILGYVLGYHELQKSVELLLGAGVVGALRHAIKKEVV